MKEFLKKLIAERERRAKQLREKIKESSDANEVRALGETLETILEELRDAQAQLENLDDDGNGDGNGTPAGGDEGRGANPMHEFHMRGQYQTGGQGDGQGDDPTDTQEYRAAFQAFVMRGTPIPMELRENANTMTSDVSSVIPTVVVNRIIERMEETGTILNLVTRTSYAAGVEIPTSSTKPVATWVSEGKGSDRQKKTTGKITFTYFKLRCEVSVSMETHTMALSAFETKLAENVAKAMVKAIEAAIINGTGNGQPKGILAETPNEGQTIDATGGVTYKLLCDAEAAVPAEYETSAKWCMTKKNFMSIVGMTDDQGQPVARVNYGVSGKPERSILGRDVVITETAPAAKSFIFDFSDYILNTIYDMGVQRKQDWDTEDMLTKAVMSVDGKTANKDSLVIMTLAAS